MLDTHRSIRTIPFRVLARLLAITFAAEVGVMLLLPAIFTKRVGAWTEASVDAFLLVLILSPSLWWLIVRPLQREHKESESRLGGLVAAQSRILESFFKHTQTCLVFLDERFNFIRVNEAYAKACRRDVSEFAGRNHFELYPSDAKAEFERVVQTREPFQALGRPFTFSDHPEWGATYWDLTLVPIQDDRGEVEFLVLSLNDVTERKRSEEVLRESQAQLQLISENVLDLVAQITLDGTYAYVSLSYETVLGYSPQRLMGTSAFAFVHSEDLERVQAVFAEAIQRGTGRVEFRYRHADGHYVWVDTLGKVFIDKAGAPAGAVLSARDITERKQLEAQFRQAQKMDSVGQLTSGIAHDFNNLLTVINGTAELVLAQVSPDDPVHADVQEIFRAGERAATLTRQLLAFSRQQILEPRVLNLNTVVTGLESLLRRLLGEDIDLVVVPIPDVAHVKADPGQIEQVITNLAVNARDAMPQGGRLTIETENVEVDEAYARQHGLAAPSGPYVMLSVSDSGIGMDETTRARIFEPFFTTKGLGKGTGLGLSTVYGIVRQSHGFIWVYSEVGQGTSFRIYLPQVTEAAGPDRPEPTVVSSSGTETILLVEDNAGLRKLATRVLKPAGYTVLGAATGEEALIVLERHEAPVHLLLSDVVMPGMSGRELAELLAETHPAMKVLYMSGYASDIMVRHGVLDAQVSFLHKPFSAAALLRKVREVLDS